MLYWHTWFHDSSFPSVKALRFLKPVLGHVLRHMLKHGSKYVPARHILEHMLRNMLRHVPKHVPDRHVLARYVLGLKQKIEIKFSQKSCCCLSTQFFLIIIFKTVCTIW